MVTTTITSCQNDGDQMRLYYNLSGNCAAPVWVEHVGIVGDLNLGDTDDENQVQRRGAGKLKTYNPGDTEVAITGTQIVQGNYQGFQVINSAKKGGSPRHLMVLTAPISNVNAIGYSGNWFNFERSISGPAEGEQEASFNLKPAACQSTACEVKAVKVLTAGTPSDWDQTVISS
jgi:hypothetical protein